MRGLKTVVIIALLSSAGAAYAQHQTPLTRGRGLSGQIGLQATSIDDEQAVLLEVGGAWAVSRSLAVGLAGYSLLSSHRFARSAEEGAYRLRGGYGGVTVGYQYPSERPVYLSGQLLIGGGLWGDVNAEAPPETLGFLDAFAVAEPSLSFGVDVLPFMQAILTGSYRLTRGTEAEGLNDASVSGPAATLSFRFGRF